MTFAGVILMMGSILNAAYGFSERKVADYSIRAVRPLIAR
jgi:hypothetical protein